MGSGIPFGIINILEILGSLLFDININAYNSLSLGLELPRCSEKLKIRTIKIKLIFQKMKNLRNKLLKLSVLFLLLAILHSCGSTNTSQGAATGAMVGGLVDGWEGAAIGALVGGGVGLMADSAEDKKIRQHQKEKELELLRKSSISKDEKTAFRPSSNNQLTGSTWRVISLVDEENNTEDFASIILSFPTNTKVTTLILWKDGKSETYGETYTMVGDALIFSGKDYITNTKYSLDGNRLVVVSPTFQAVLEEVD